MFVSQSGKYLVRRLPEPYYFDGGFLHEDVVAGIEFLCDGQMLCRASLTAYDKPTAIRGLKTLHAWCLWLHCSTKVYRSIPQRVRKISEGMCYKIIDNLKK